MILDKYGQFSNSANFSLSAADAIGGVSFFADWIDLDVVRSLVQGSPLAIHLQCVTAFGIGAGTPFASFYPILATAIVLPGANIGATIANLAAVSPVILPGSSPIGASFNLAGAQPIAGDRFKIPLSDGLFGGGNFGAVNQGLAAGRVSSTLDRRFLGLMYINHSNVWSGGIGSYNAGVVSASLVLDNLDSQGKIYPSRVGFVGDLH